MDPERDYCAACGKDIGQKGVGPGDRWTCAACPGEAGDDLRDYCADCYANHGHIAEAVAAKTGEHPAPDWTPPSPPARVVAQTLDASAAPGGGS